MLPVYGAALGFLHEKTEISPEVVNVKLFKKVLNFRYVDNYRSQIYSRPYFSPHIKLYLLLVYKILVHH